MGTFPSPQVTKKLCNFTEGREAPHSHLLTKKELVQVLFVHRGDAINDFSFYNPSMMVERLWDEGRAAPPPHAPACSNTAILLYVTKFFVDTSPIALCELPLLRRPGMSLSFRAWFSCHDVPGTKTAHLKGDARLPQGRRRQRLKSQQMWAANSL